MNDYPKWIKAINTLAENEFSQVLCPDCGLAFLNVQDEQLDNSHVDRHLKCSHCGAHKTVLIKTGTHAP